ncbi:helix-turn-helix transcriptional regulator [Streptomyces sp. RFCAC02]|uniref:helix-turn-helix domain-containing protein n=1 Tax=Streptomyces sp. RFCAC02 TaxID=2499143 RepID=UPI00143E0C00|nr:helix-turn-helix transcriptional regulator [Streptomyces sp. RFCAC02]
MRVECGGSASALKQLGLRLRTMRAGAGRSLPETAAAIGVPAVRLHGLETGRLVPEPAQLRPLLAFYDRAAETESVLAELRHAGRTPWWTAYRDLLPRWLADHLRAEERAEAIRYYAPLLVPDLLQTAEYAAALLRLQRPTDDEATTARRLDLLARRQCVLDRREPRPPAVWALIEESVLHRRVGDAGVMERQLAHLRHLSALPGITIQVMPMHTTHRALMSGPVELLRFPGPHLPDRLVLHTAAGASVSLRTKEVRHYLMALDSAACAPDTVPIGAWPGRRAAGGTACPVAPPRRPGGTGGDHGTMSN